MPDQVTTPEEEEKELAPAVPEDDPRIQMIDIIAGQVEAEREPDQHPTDGENILPREDEKQEAQADDSSGTQEDTEEEGAEQQEAEGQTSEASQEIASGTEETRTLTIDGVEQEVPLSQIEDAGTRALQKDMAADRRLEEATRLLQQAQAARQSGQLSTPDAARTVAEANQADKKRVAELLDAIRYGEEAEAEAALQEVITTRSAGGASKEEIIASVRQELAQNAIRARLYQSPEDGGFKDLMDDPKLYQLARLEIDELVSKGATYEDWTTYQKAGEAVRAWANKSGVSASPVGKGNGNTLESKQLKKKNIDVVKSVQAKTKPTPDDNEPVPVQQTIAEMAKARGQEHYI